MIDPKVCKLILQMARENPRWGYLRIKGELGKLGIRASEATLVALLASLLVGAILVVPSMVALFVLSQRPRA